MAGLTPFQFSSNKIQATRSFSVPMLKSGFVGDTFQSLLSWYEMWINPASVSISEPFIQNKQHTAGSIVTYHYRKDVATMQVAGAIGWVMIQSVIEEAKNSLMNATVQVVNGKPVTAFDRTVRNFDVNDPNGPFRQSVDLTVRNGASGRMNNSPRLFLQRLKSLAYEPTYYIDKNGIEHYNVKYIKMFTKQYPNGVICEGYFTNFKIDEKSDDAQTIEYSFEFIIENIKPVTMIQRIVGMYADIGSAAGDITGLVGGFF